MTIMKITDKMKKFPDKTLATRVARSEPPRFRIFSFKNSGRQLKLIENFPL